jgi:hypothetical protein
VKFSNQTNCALPPKGPSTKTDCWIACAAGQMKKIKVMAICGATSK